MLCYCGERKNNVIEIFKGLKGGRYGVGDLESQDGSKSPKLLH